MKLLKNTISLISLESIAIGINLHKDFVFITTIESLRNEADGLQWSNDMNANCEEYLPYEEPDGFVPLDEELFDELIF